MVTTMNTSYSKFDWISTSLQYNDNSHEIQSFKVFSLPSKIKSKKVIHILHGYTESCHYMNPFIDFFLEKDFEVMCLELPNHGSSSGKRYDIDNFETYLLHIEAYTKTLDKNREHYFIAHSTGAVGITKYLKKYKASPFKKIFLISPLTRPIFYSMIKFSIPMLSKMINKVKRIEQIRGPEYTQARETDEHYYGYLPLNWTLNCINFVEKQTENPTKDINNVVSIFGTGDRIIDASDGFTKYSKWFPNSNVHMIEGGQHHLHFAPSEVKHEFFDIIDSYL